MNGFCETLVNIVEAELKPDQIIGYSEEELRQAEDRLGARLPFALRHFYGFVGRTPRVTDGYYKFLTLSELDFFEGAMAFCRLWKVFNLVILRSDFDAIDPPVFETKANGNAVTSKKTSLCSHLIRRACLELYKYDEMESAKKYVRLLELGIINEDETCGQTLDRFIFTQARFQRQVMEVLRDLPKTVLVKVYTQLQQESKWPDVKWQSVPWEYVKRCAESILSESEEKPR